MSDAHVPLLAVNNLRTFIPTKRGMVRAVDGVCFHLHLGETLAIVGESGCGKSVLCRTIMGLPPEKAQTGKNASIQFNGQELIGLGENQYRRLRATQMAMVFQDSLSSLHPTMTVGRQVSESLCYHFKMRGTDAKRRTLALIEAVGLSRPARCAALFPHQLSGGMRQRVAIAIALACDPKLLIADEPTTALDTTVQAGILALLNHLQKERKMALMLITHDLGVASNVADRVAVMYAGKIVETATARDLFERPCHPYTKALIDAVPQMDPSGRAVRPPIQGQPCDLVDPPAGCRFSARCARAEDRCRRQEPALGLNPAKPHACACWHPLGDMSP